MWINNQLDLLTRKRGRGPEVLSSDPKRYRQLIVSVTPVPMLFSLTVEIHAHRYVACVMVL